MLWVGVDEFVRGPDVEVYGLQGSHSIGVGADGWLQWNVCMVPEASLNVRVAGSPGEVWVAYGFGGSQGSMLGLGCTAIVQAKNPSITLVLVALTQVFVPSSMVDLQIIIRW